MAKETCFCRLSVSIVRIPQILEISLRNLFQLYVKFEVFKILHHSRHVHVCQHNKYFAKKFKLKGISKQKHVCHS